MVLQMSEWALRRVPVSASSTTSELAPGTIRPRVSSMIRPTLSVWAAVATPTRAMVKGTMPSTIWKPRARALVNPSAYRTSENASVSSRMPP
ncbi:hypothetical protein SGLAM104S_08785 [Streptomyces glaucescens]